jgi:hypothetical protein
MAGRLALVKDGWSEDDSEYLNSILHGSFEEMIETITLLHKLERNKHQEELLKLLRSRQPESAKGNDRSGKTAHRNKTVE